MPFNSWKFFNNFKTTITKFSIEKSIQINVLQPFVKLSETSCNFKEYLEYGKKKLTPFQRMIPLDEMQSKKSIEKNKTWNKNDRALKTKFLDGNDKIRYILECLNLSISEQEIIENVEKLSYYINQFPEVRYMTIKNGVIRMLLNKREHIENEFTKSSIREALTLLGYIDPVPCKGIRILSIDGGGIRGVLVLEMLKKIEELTGKRTYELFDFICGVSTGAILTYSIGIHFRKLEDIIIRYKELSQEIFQQSPIRGTGNLVWSHSYYDTALWEEKLKDYVGSDTLISTSRNPKTPKLCVVSTIVNQSQTSAYLFRNYTLPWRFQSYYLGTHKKEIWQAARASAAAPTYFEEFRIDDLIHQDGGILVNNPTAIAIHEAKLLWPNTPIQCVVSFGTGRCAPVRAEENIIVNELSNDKRPVGTSWTNKFYKILDSATDTEAVHVMLNDLLPGNIYYRFNPYLSERVKMIETDENKHEQLKRDALMYLRRNDDKFQEAAKSLMLKKSIRQLIIDKINVRREMMGL